MTYEHKDGTGTLFPNDKGDNHRRPDYRGEAKIDGKLIEIAGWKKQGNKGPYLSLSFKLKGQKEQEGGKADFDDDIPF